MIADDPELIQVRPEENLDLTRLEPYLRRHLPDTEGPLEVAQFGGGYANLTYLLRFGDREYVLRRPPLGPVAPSSHDMAREHAVLARLPDAFPLAPRSYLYCEDPGILGVHFHVMERRRGRVIRYQLPERLKGRPELNRRLGEMLVDTLVELHGIEAAAVGLGDLGRPEGFVARQLDGWTRRWHAAKDRDSNVVDRLVEWLTDRVPSSPHVTLLHNDYKLDNLLLDPEDPATPTAVLDWDMCVRGDPLMDLGYLLNFWPGPDDDPSWQAGFSMPFFEVGFPSRDEVVQRYCSRSGRSCQQLNWYHAFGALKLLVILQQIYIRYLRGQTRDPRFAELGRAVSALARKGLSLSAGG